jgi:iron complex outermembrane receptor protein
VNRIGQIAKPPGLAFSIVARNLSDEKAGIHGYHLTTLCGCNELSFRPPRTFVVNMKYQF